MRQALLILSLLIGFQAQAATASDPLPYDRLQQKSVHNAYQRHESLEDMLTNRHLRSLELDIYVDKSGRPRLTDDWYVYHSKSDSKSSLDTLRQGLSVLRQFHLSHPTHEVVTLWMDLKEKFLQPDHGPEDLDRIFDDILGTALFTPSELMQRCPGAVDLQDSVQRPGCGWPTSDELRGRFMIVLTEAPNMAYVEQGQTALERKAFIAVADLQRFVVFYNLPKDGVKDLGKHLITRTWDVNDAGTWKKFAARGVHHLATNKVDAAKDPWSTTLQADGGLFAIIP